MRKVYPRKRVYIDVPGDERFAPFLVRLREALPVGGSILSAADVEEDCDEEDSGPDSDREPPSEKPATRRRK